MLVYGIFSLFIYEKCHLLGHNISDGLFFFCIFRCVKIQFHFFLFLDGLLVSFDIALQIFFRWLEFEYLNLTASFSSSLYMRKLLQVFGSLDGSWIPMACSSDLDGMHYLNEIISLQSATKNNEN
ncbi:unnamed protein product [Rhizophagus irregularis]|nr:unnamed protein product [Rhizophagus irregularis]